ncbi:MAG: calcium/sodium antiporter [Bacteroidales bacterium]|nr:calcium/sodium antiporter [Bacteroidales bacterium]
MDILIDILYIVIGFVLLVKGGDYLVDGAVAIARKAKLSSMVIGLTIVGFGTSAPELLVSLQAALAGSPGISIGNVVGSNIANIALILGVTSIICACPASKSTLAIDTPFMALSVILFMAVAMTGTISRIAGVVAVLMLVSFIVWQIRNSRKNAKNDDSNDEQIMPLWKSIVIVLLSFAALVIGADVLIDGAQGVAKSFGVSERIIGLTIIAVGTSLPELFASIMAARKGETDMAIGNVIGSVTFNVLCVIGLSAVVCEIHDTAEGFLFDYILMVALGLLLWLFLFTKRNLERWEGVVLVLIYIGYIVRTVVMQ